MRLPTILANPLRPRLLPLLGLFPLALPLMMLHPPVAAQETVGTLVGTVTDNKGAALEGVQIKLSGPKILQGRTTLTDDKGHFRIPLLPTGIHGLSVTKEGYTGGSVKVEILPGSTLRQNLRLMAIPKAAK